MSSIKETTRIIIKDSDTCRIYHDSGHDTLMDRCNEQWAAEAAGGRSLGQKFDMHMSVSGEFVVLTSKKHPHVDALALPICSRLIEIVHRGRSMCFC